MSDDVLVQLIGSLYEVALAPAQWQAWLDQLCRALGVQAGVLIARFEPNVGDQGVFTAGLPDRAGEDAGTAASPPFPAQPRPRAPYLDYLAQDSRLFHKALVLQEGELLVLSELLAEEEFVATRFYREWLRPRDLHHVLCVIVSRTSRSITGLSLLRRPERPAFAQAELDLLRRLLPHLQRVVQLQERLAETELKHEVAHSILDSLRCGALLVDGAGRVCDANERAAALLERAEGIRLEGAALQAEDPRETPALRRLVHAAVCARDAPRGGVLAISRGGGRQPLVVSASPLQQSGARAPWLPVARALVLLSDPEDLPSLHEPALQQLYGLTQAEARVAARLATGESVDEIAASLGVRRATVRTHLQRALEKTGTRRQAELVRLLLMANRGLAEPSTFVR